MKKILSILAIIVSLVPVLGYAALINCGNTANDQCDFNDLIYTLNGIVQWIISMSVIIFTLCLIYGGYLYMTSGAKPGNKDKAKSLFLSTLWGFLIILTGWLIVNTLLQYLLPKDSDYIFKFIGKTR